jgi:DNA-binding MarR family transcriptional regulator
MASTVTRADAATEAWALSMDLFAEARPRMLDIQAEYGLKPPQFFALDALDEPVPMSHIADMLRCDRSAVTWITDRLEERGYVERRADERDRRVKLLALTDEGRRVREEIRRRLAVPPEALGRLSRAEQRELRDLLRKALGR